MVVSVPPFFSSLSPRVRPLARINELEEFIHIDDENNEEFIAAILKDVEELLGTMKSAEENQEDDNDDDIVTSQASGSGLGNTVAFKGFEALYKQVVEIDDDQLLCSEVEEEAGEEFDDFRNLFEPFQKKTRAITLKAKRKSVQNLRQMTILDMLNLDIESDELCDHLMVLTDSLNKTRSLIYPPIKKQSRLGESLYSLSDIVEKEHKRLLARKSVIEKRKEEHERQMLEKEREEESRRLQQQKTTEEAEQRRLAVEYTRREEQRIRREIEERELQEAQALLLQSEKGPKKKGKRAVLEGEKVTKAILIEMALSEQLKERQEMEKKLLRLAKTMDYIERAKREEEAPLIEQAFEQHLEEEKIVHEHEQLKDIELSKQHHAGDIQEKNRLTRILDKKITLQKRIEDRRDAEYKRLKEEAEYRINQQKAMKKHDREIKRKLLHYIKTEEERLTIIREEEQARKLEEEERRKKEEAERKAKLDEIAEKQRQRERELDEKERLRKEALRKNIDHLPRPADSVTSLRPVEPAASAAAAAAAAPAPAKYVPRYRREGTTAPPAEPDKRRDDRPPQSSDKWRSDDRDHRSSFGGSRLPYSSSRTRG